MENEVLEILKQIDYKGIIAEYIIHNILDSGIKQVNKIFSREGVIINKKIKNKLSKIDYEDYLLKYNLEISQKIILKSIVDNINRSNNWSKEISFNLSRSSKKLDKVFIDLDLFLSPLKNRFSPDEQLEKERSDVLFKNIEDNIIIVGGPGAGKTTLLKDIYSKCLKSSDMGKKFTCPIVIRFREINYPKSHNALNPFGLYSILLETFGIIIKYPEKNLKEIHNEHTNLIKLTIKTFLEDSKILLILDGFDEVPDNEIKLTVERDIQDLLYSLNNSKIILTSRTGEIHTNLSNAKIFEICPLSDKQITSLINRWLEDVDEANELFNKIKNSPFYDATMRPLILSHLCAIYDRKKTIPPKPRYIYDFIIQMLLESWDEERGIIRVSDYADFYIEKKKEFLANMAFYFSYNLHKTQFSSSDIRLCYTKIHRKHNLPTSQAKKVVTEIESHTGLFIQSAYDSFQFSHKSLQEYLTAKYITALPSIPHLSMIESLPNEIAIVISLVSDPNPYFEFFIKNLDNFQDRFLEIFSSRLTEEKPDFNEEPIPLVFFLYALDKNKEKPNYLTILNNFHLLIERTNLKISCKSFYNIYSSSQVYENSTCFIYKVLDKPLSERHYLPGKLYINNAVEGKLAMLR